MNILDQVFKNGLVTFVVLAAAALGAAFALYVLVNLFFNIYHLFLRIYLPWKMAEEEELIRQWLYHRSVIEHSCSTYHATTKSEIDNLNFSQWAEVSYQNHTVHVPYEAWNLMRLWSAYYIQPMRRILYEFDDQVNLPTHERLFKLISTFIPTSLRKDTDDPKLSHDFLDGDAINRFSEAIPLFLSYYRHRLRMLELNYRATLSPAN